MPTGYTADIAKGITFEQYAWDCARAFGALVTLRDEPHAPIPERFEPDGYYQKRLEEVHATLVRISEWTPEEIASEYQIAFDSLTAAHQKRIDDAEALRAKYEAMLAQVRAWQPPTPDHVAYKEFMESQIVESIKFDCCLGYDRAPLPQEPAAWHAEWIADLRATVARCEQQQRDEVKRAHDRTLWVKAIRDSFAKERS
ncbi:hypothetical protein WL21_32640 [Burkholderia ubonensis]|uniref:hypothetical protein n=1 Tax=Burkholderia ubonensis TaxID=101571 RepID=UPI00075EB7FE|nr:hypothetical protein [Burkholderia ubonensis]KVO95525.1 hypothetical protein WJ81_02620 [Burkholderia ubonensis]KVZ58448.1 hypothetical protein WL20_22275 [Burkholderia ubonensis]KVZ75157.1 hypothetical protein WL21_32640 [Burkholderia ubonensis]